MSQSILAAITPAREATRVATATLVGAFRERLRKGLFDDNPVLYVAGRYAEHIERPERPGRA